MSGYGEPHNPCEAIVRVDKIMTGLVGIDGKNGKIGEMMATIKEHESRLRQAEVAIARGYVVAGGVAAVGAALFSWILNKL